MLINVGDEIESSPLAPNTREIVEEIQQGKHGLFIRTKDKVSDDHYKAFYPYELPPEDPTENWYNWDVRAYDTIHKSGRSPIKLGWVSCNFDENCHTVEAYDAKWEETIKLMEA